MTLQGNGVLANSGSCSLTLQGLQLFPALREEVNFSARGPVLFTSRQPGCSYRPWDWSFAAVVITEWHVPGPAGNQYLYSSHRSGCKHTPSLTCIHPETCEGKLLDNRRSDCSRNHPSHIPWVLLYPLLLPNPNEELYSQIWLGWKYPETPEWKSFHFATKTHRSRGKNLGWRTPTSALFYILAADSLTWWLV